MKNRYRNLWQKETRVLGPAFYENDAPCVLEYRTVKVYCLRPEFYDFVLNGACISQRAGITEARKVIDEYLDGKQPCAATVAAHITVSGFHGYTYSQCIEDWEAGRAA